MSEVAVQRMIASACLEVASEGAFTRDLRAFLVSHGLAAPDVEAICAAPQRLALYRRLVRNNLVGVTHRMMPRTRARLNALGGLFDAAFDTFLEARGPRTHYLRDVPAEFLAWATSHWRDHSRVPAYAADLAAHELVEFEICAMPSSPAAPPLAEVALDRALIFSDALRLMRYDHAVHLLPADEADRSEPEARAVTLLVYRDAEHSARFLELSPLAAAIITRLLSGEPLGEGIARACAALEHALSDAILADTARLLADLGERGVLLGARDA
jgi:hypothetical protein